MLEIDQLEVEWKEISLKYDVTVEAGEILTIQGRSGVGKTTLLNVIAGFEQAARGDVRWNGKSLLKLKVTKRPVCMLFQEHNLFERPARQVANEIVGRTAAAYCFVAYFVTARADCIDGRAVC